MSSRRVKRESVKAIVQLIETKTVLPEAGSVHASSLLGGSRTNPAGQERRVMWECDPGVPPAVGARTGATPLPRLLTFGWVPIQAFSGAHEGARRPPPRAPSGPRPLQPGVGSEPPPSSMPAGGARPWCTAPRARPEAAARAPGFRLPAACAPRGRAQILAARSDRARLTK